MLNIDKTTLPGMPLDNPVLILLDQRLVALKKKKKQPFTLTKKRKHLLQIAV